MVRGSFMIIAAARPVRGSIQDGARRPGRRGSRSGSRVPTGGAAGRRCGRSPAGARPPRAAGGRDRRRRPARNRARPGVEASIRWRAKLSATPSPLGRVETLLLQRGRAGVSPGRPRPSWRPAAWPEKTSQSGVPSSGAAFAASRGARRRAAPPSKRIASGQSKVTAFSGGRMGRERVGDRRHAGERRRAGRCAAAPPARAPPRTPRRRSGRHRRRCRRPPPAAMRQAWAWASPRSRRRHERVGGRQVESGSVALSAERGHDVGV